MPIKKVSIFLMIIGMEKGQRVMSLMDISEIKAVVPEIRRMETHSPETQKSVWAEFKELGYEDTMKRG